MEIGGLVCEILSRSDARGVVRFVLPACVCASTRNLSLSVCARYTGSTPMVD